MWLELECQVLQETVGCLDSDEGKVGDVVTREIENTE